MLTAEKNKKQKKLDNTFLSVVAQPIIKKYEI